MKIQTFTIVVGTAACNAKCPFCISKMTPRQGVSFQEPEINWRNFDKACRLAEINHVSTVLLTGKGEPLLYPEQITDFLEAMKSYKFPLIEVQTNGLCIARNFEKYKTYLKKWYRLGLNTIALSIVHYRDEENKKVYTPDSKYMDLEKLIAQLHKLGFSVRLSCMLAKEFIDTPEEVEKLAEKAKSWKVEQLTVRSIRTPNTSENMQVFAWTKKHALENKEIQKIADFLKKNAKKVMTLEHGAVVYDLNGQNICHSDCLTLEPETANLRQLIFFPDGHLRYDWQYRGATLL